MTSKIRYAFPLKAGLSNLLISCSLLLLLHAILSFRSSHVPTAATHSGHPLHHRPGLSARDLRPILPPAFLVRRQTNTTTLTATAFAIRNLNSGNYLENGGSRSPGSRVIATQQNLPINYSQLWIYDEVEKTLQNVLTLRCLVNLQAPDVDDPGANELLGVRTEPCTDSEPRQKWTLNTQIIAPQQVIFNVATGECLSNFEDGPPALPNVPPVSSTATTTATTLFDETGWDLVGNSTGSSFLTFGLNDGEFVVTSSLCDSTVDSIGGLGPVGFGGEESMWALEITTVEITPPITTTSIVGSSTTSISADHFVTTTLISTSSLSLLATSTLFIATTMSLTSHVSGTFHGSTAPSSHSWFTRVVATGTTSEISATASSIEPTSSAIWMTFTSDIVATTLTDIKTAFGLESTKDVTSSQVKATLLPTTSFDFTSALEVSTTESWSATTGIVTSTENEVGTTSQPTSTLSKTWHSSEWSTEMTATWMKGSTISPTSIELKTAFGVESTEIVSVATSTATFEKSSPQVTATITPITSFDFTTALEVSMTESWSANTDIVSTGVVTSTEYDVETTYEPTPSQSKTWSSVDLSTEMSATWTEGSTYSSTSTEIKTAFGLESTEGVPVATSTTNVGKSSSHVMATLMPTTNFDSTSVFEISMTEFWSSSTGVITSTENDLKSTFGPIPSNSWSSDDWSTEMNATWTEGSTFSPTSTDIKTAFGVESTEVLPVATSTATIEKLSSQVTATLTLTPTTSFDFTSVSEVSMTEGWSSSTGVITSTENDVQTIFEPTPTQSKMWSSQDWSAEMSATWTEESTLSLPPTDIKTAFGDESIEVVPSATSATIFGKSSSEVTATLKPTTSFDFTSALVVSMTESWTASTGIATSTENDVDTTFQPTPSKTWSSDYWSTEMSATWTEGSTFSLTLTDIKTAFGVESTEVNPIATSSTNVEKSSSQVTATLAPTTSFDLTSMFEVSTTEGTTASTGITTFTETDVETTFQSTPSKTWSSDHWLTEMSATWTEGSTYSSTSTEIKTAFGLESTEGVPIATSTTSFVESSHTFGPTTTDYFISTSTEAATIGTTSDPRTAFDFATAFTDRDPSSTLISQTGVFMSTSFLMKDDGATSVEPATSTTVALETTLEPIPVTSWSSGTLSTNIIATWGEISLSSPTLSTDVVEITSTNVLVTSTNAVQTFPDVLTTFEPTPATTKSDFGGEESTRISTPSVGITATTTWSVHGSSSEISAAWTGSRSMVQPLPSFSDSTAEDRITSMTVSTWRTDKSTRDSGATGTESNNHWMSSTVFDESSRTVGRTTSTNGLPSVLSKLGTSFAGPTAIPEWSSEINTKSTESAFLPTVAPTTQRTEVTTTSTWSRSTEGESTEITARSTETSTFKSASAIGSSVVDKGVTSTPVSGAETTTELKTAFDEVITSTLRSTSAIQSSVVTKDGFTSTPVSATETTISELKTAFDQVITKTMSQWPTLVQSSDQQTSTLVRVSSTTIASIVKSEFTFRSSLVSAWTAVPSNHHTVQSSIIVPSGGQGGQSGTTAGSTIQFVTDTTTIVAPTTQPNAVSSTDISQITTTTQQTFAMSSTVASAITVVTSSSNVTTFIGSILLPSTIVTTILTSTTPVAASALATSTSTTTINIITSVAGSNLPPTTSFSPPVFPTTTNATTIGIMTSAAGTTPTTLPPTTSLTPPVFVTSTTVTAINATTNLPPTTTKSQATTSTCVCPTTLVGSSTCPPGSVPGSSRWGNASTWLSEYNVFALKDVNGSQSYIGGRIAAGNSLTLRNGYSVGSKIYSPSKTCSESRVYARQQGIPALRYAVFVGETYYGISGLVENGDVAVGKDATGGRGGGVSWGSWECWIEKYSIPSPIDFLTASIYLRTLSQALSNLPDTASYFVPWWGSTMYVTLSGTSTYEVITVDAKHLSQAREILFTNGSKSLHPKATLIINIKTSSSTTESLIAGTSPILSISSISPLGSLSESQRSRVVWNVLGAGEVRLRSVSMYGLIIAPGADVVAPTGSMVGQMFVRSFGSGWTTSGAGSATMSVDWGRFEGCLPNV
ncbi:hypothetical protein HK102_013245, partial [Quaeritorhiza haematococci]